MQLAQHRNKLSHINAEQKFSTSHLKNLPLWVPVMIVMAVVAVVNLPASSIQSSDEVSWLSKLASAGDGGAQLQIGLAYREGRYGLTPDPVKGMQWLKRAAHNGNAYAEYTLGEMYAEGQGAAKDPKLASQWWKKAMQDGNAEARVKLIESMVQSGEVKQAESLLQ
jgi:TPR repeat protein